MTQANAKNPLTPRPTPHASKREALEFAAVWFLVRAIGILPRPIARGIGASIGALAFHLLARLRETGLRNLELAFPDWPRERRDQTLRTLYARLGQQLAEFCLMSRYTPQQASQFIEYDGLDHYLQAVARGKGTLVLTGHLGAWELSSFYHSLMGHRMGMVIRRLDNPFVDAFVNRIRCLHGNRVLHKDDFARALLGAMRANETVGILMDTNMTPPQGVFVPFFGVPACTASGLARIALKTEATVLPGYLAWHEDRQRYILHFGAPVELIRTNDPESDVQANTAQFTAILEHHIRLYPDQWLWMHRRWKTRPPNTPTLY